MKGCERIIRPGSLIETLRLLSELKGETTLLGGGTDLFVSARLFKEKKILKDNLIAVKDVPELSGVREERNHISVGAATVLSDVISSPVTVHYAPLLAAASLKIASPQIRNAGTIGGNVVNASPAGDGLTALVCMKADAVIGRLEEGKEYFYTVPVTQLIAGPRKTTLADDELIVRFEIPKYESCTYRYEKIGVRSAMAISVAAVAAMREKSGRVHIALGAMGPRTIEHAGAEKLAAEGRTDEAVRCILDACSPIDDIRATAQYRMAAVRKLLFGVLSEL